MKKLDLKLIEATTAMQGHMDAYREACRAGWKAEEEKRLLHDTTDRFGRDLSNTIARRIRSRLGSTHGSVDVTCHASINHIDYTVRPSLRITLNIQARRTALDYNTTFATVESTWAIHGPTISNIEEVIKLVVATAKLNAGPIK